jgi:phage N-6-adenine-methyltransferase
MGSYVQSLYREAMADDNNGDIITPDGGVVTVRQPAVEKYSAVIAEDPSMAKRMDAAAKSALNYQKSLNDIEGVSDVAWRVIDIRQAIVDEWDRQVAPNRRPSKNETNSDRGYIISVAEAEAMFGVRQQKVSTWRKELRDPQTYHERLCGKVIKQFLDGKNEASGDEDGGRDSPRISSTGFYEWYTPPQFIESAREAMGDIDLDPATSHEAQNVVNAKAFFTKEDDGLKKEWNGRVWLNPPYSQPLLGDFVSKLVDEYTSGSVKQAIILTHNFTDTGWFHRAASVASAICFTRGRINFYGEKGGPGSPTNGQAFCYFGEDVNAFADAFSKHGFIVTPFRWSGLQTVELQANEAGDEQ